MTLLRLKGNAQWRPQMITDNMNVQYTHSLEHAMERQEKNDPSTTLFRRLLSYYNINMPSQHDVNNDTQQHKIYYQTTPIKNDIN